MGGGGGGGGGGKGRFGGGIGGGIGNLGPMRDDGDEVSACGGSSGMEMERRFLGCSVMLFAWYELWLAKLGERSAR